MSGLFSRAFWAKAGERAIRSGAQGFLVGAGVGSTAGDFAILSLASLGSGLAGLASMALLSVATSVAFPPEG